VCLPPGQAVPVAWLSFLFVGKEADGKIDTWLIFIQGFDFNED